MERPMLPAGILKSLYTVQLEHYCDYLEKQIDLSKDNEFLKIVGHNTHKEVINLVIEESSELIKELTKQNRGIGNVENLIEEIADVYIVLNQLKVKLKIDNEEIMKKINEKINRTVERFGL